MEVLKMNKVEIIFRDIVSTSGSNYHAVLLIEKGGYRNVAILADSERVLYLKAALFEVQTAIKTLYDLVILIGNTANIEIQEALIKGEGEILVGILKLKMGGVEHSVPMYPIDAVILALKAGKPIYVDEDFITEKGIIIVEDDNKELEEEAYSEKPKDAGNAKEKSEDESGMSIEERVIKLREELQEAINKEDYERAAEIRDEINKLLKHLK
jgi:bifunctional DNase/RNase